MTELDEAVAALTEPVIYQHAGGINGNHTTTLPPRLEQLEHAIGSSMGSGGRTSGSLKAAMNVIDSDALYRFLLIKNSITDWCVKVGAPRTGNPSTDLRAWARIRKPQPSEWHLHKMREWVTLIDNLLDRQEELEVTEPCTDCGARSWLDQSGETRTNPVRIVYRKEDPRGTVRAVCNACEKTWEGEMAIRSLRFQIEARDAS